MVQNYGFPSESVLDVKIAVLAFVLEQLKHERRAPEELVKFEGVHSMRGLFRHCQADRVRT